MNFWLYRYTNQMNLFLEKNSSILISYLKQVVAN